MKTNFFTWDNIKLFFKELVLTLGSKPSLFSQKKLLVYLIDISMLVTSLIYLYTKRATLTAADLCMIVGLWLAKGTTNVIMTQKDKKTDSTDSDDKTDNVAPADDAPAILKD